MSQLPAPSHRALANNFIDTEAEVTPTGLKPQNLYLQNNAFTRRAHDIISFANLTSGGATDNPLQIDDRAERLRRRDGQLTNDHPALGRKRRRTNTRGGGTQVGGDARRTFADAAGAAVMCNMGPSGPHPSARGAPSRCATAKRLPDGVAATAAMLEAADAHLRRRRTTPATRREATHEDLRIVAHGALAALAALRAEMEAESASTRMYNTRASSR